MTPFDPAELSGLLDGELSLERAEEMRHLLTSDPTLHEQYERLVRLNAVWKSDSSRLVFRPQVSLTGGLMAHRLIIACLVLSIVLIRLTLKLVPQPIEIGVALVLFAFLLGWGLRLVLRETEEDCHWLVERSASGTT